MCCSLKPVNLRTWLAMLYGLFSKLIGKDLQITITKSYPSLASQTTSSPPFLQTDVIGRGGRVWWIAYQCTNPQPFHVHSSAGSRACAGCTICNTASPIESKEVWACSVHHSTTPYPWATSRWDSYCNSMHFLSHSIINCICFTITQLTVIFPLHMPYTFKTHAI